MPSLSPSTSPSSNQEDATGSYHERSHGGRLVDTDEEDTITSTENHTLFGDDDDNDDEKDESNTKDTSDDDEYIPTQSHRENEADEEFHVEDYVDEVQMKREEDAAEARAEVQKGRVNKLTVQTDAATVSSKRQSNARSPASQLEGTIKKKANVPAILTTANSTAIYKRVDLNSSNRRKCNRMTDDSVSTPERNN